MDKSWYRHNIWSSTQLYARVLAMSQGTSDPHLKQTNAYHRYLAASGDIAERVLKILWYMEELHINLPIFLWAISWNIEELVSNPHAWFARTTLMLSEELPGILTHWHQPPWQHNPGVQTKAAKLAMTEWALEMLCDTIDEELWYPRFKLTLQFSGNWSLILPACRNKHAETRTKTALNRLLIIPLLSFYPLTASSY